MTVPDIHRCGVASIHRGEDTAIRGGGAGLHSRGRGEAAILRRGGAAHHRSGGTTLRHRGMAALHEAGAHTMAQNEASSVVFGMPAEAIRRGVVDRVVGLLELPQRLMAEAYNKSNTKGALG